MPARFVAAVVMLGAIDGAVLFANTDAGHACRESSTLSFKLRRNYQVVVPVGVDGLEPVNFLLDTGTKTTIIDQRTARKLQHGPIARMPFTTFTGTIDVTVVRLDTVTLGTASLQGIEASCLDLRRTYSLDADIYGVLGQNFLSGFNYLLDYRSRKITMDPDGRLKDRLTGIQTPIESRDYRDYIAYESSSVTGSPFRFLLDSGTPFTVIFEDRAQDLGVRIERESARSSATSDLGNRSMETGRIRILRISCEEIKNLPVRVTPARHNEKRWEGGLLPTSLFRAIYFNHQDHSIIINPSLPPEH